jgi:hypothetical protein
LDDRTRFPFQVTESDVSYEPQIVVVMDTASLKEKAALCLRIARGLSWNNPGRLQLTELAQRFDQQARDLQTQTASTTATIGGPNLPQSRV